MIPETDVRAVFARNLRRLRAEHGWTQLELSLQSGVSTACISILERQASGPSLDVAVRLAAALGTGVDAMTASAPASRPASTRGTRDAPVPASPLKRREPPP